MQAEELKERYKMIPVWGRLAAAAVLGLVPAGLVYLDEGDALGVQLEEAGTNLETAKRDFEKASKQKAELPKLEEQKAFTEEQLAKAKKKLPDAFRVEEVLQKAATIAKETGVKFKSFKPGGQRQAAGDFKYMELPIATEIEGKFAQITAFLDRVVHLEMSIFVRNVEVNVAAAGQDDNAELGANPMNNEQGKSKYQLALDARSKLKVASKFDLVVFRAMTDADALAPATTDGLPADPGAVPAAPPAPGEPGAPAAEAPPATEAPPA